MALRQRLNQVGEKSLPLRVCQNSLILVSTRSSRREDKLCLFLRRMQTIGSLGKLERRWSFSLLLLLLFFPSLPFPSTSFSLSLPVWRNLVKWDVPFLPHVTLSLALVGFSLSTYPKLLSPILSSCDTWPIWVPLRLLFDLLSIRHMAPHKPSNMCQVLLVTLGSSKNIKFQLSRNSTNSMG